MVTMPLRLLFTTAGVIRTDGLKNTRGAAAVRSLDPRLVNAIFLHFITLPAQCQRSDIPLRQHKNVTLFIMRSGDCGMRIGKDGSHPARCLNVAIISFIVCIKPPPLAVDAEGNLALRAPCLPLSGESKPPAMRVVIDFCILNPDSFC